MHMIDLSNKENKMSLSMAQRQHGHGHHDSPLHPSKLQSNVQRPPSLVDDVQQQQKSTCMRKTPQKIVYSYSGIADSKNDIMETPVREVTAKRTDSIQVYLRVRPMDIGTHGGSGAKERKRSKKTIDAFTPRKTGRDQQDVIEHADEDAAQSDMATMRAIEVQNDTTISFCNANDEQVTFAFDHVFREDSTQEQVFQHIAAPLVDNLTDGVSGLLYAYGVTSSGKTYTTMGNERINKEWGIIPRMLHRIFETIDHFPIESRPVVRVAYLEIYNEFIYDLLALHDKQASLRQWEEFSRDKLRLNEGSRGHVFIRGLQEQDVNNAREALVELHKGNKMRQVAQTNMNSDSSRSHGVFTIRLMQPNQSDDTPDIEISQLSVVDLAGAERSKRTQVTGDQLKEASSINQSLTVLSRCMSIMRWNQRNPKSKPRIVPYRESKITHLFQDLMDREKVKVAMIVCANPNMESADETIRVLNFCNITSSVKATPRIDSRRQNTMTPSLSRSVQRLMKGPATPSARTMLQTPSTSASKPSRASSRAQIELLQNQLADLKQRLTDANSGKCDLEMEKNVREAICKDMGPRLQMTEQMFEQRLALERQYFEDLYERKLQHLEQVLQSIQQQGYESTDNDDDDGDDDNENEMSDEESDYDSEMDAGDDSENISDEKARIEYLETLTSELRKDLQYAQISYQQKQKQLQEKHQNDLVQLRTEGEKQHTELQQLLIQERHEHSTSRERSQKTAELLEHELQTVRQELEHEESCHIQTQEELERSKEQYVSLMSINKKLKKQLKDFVSKWKEAKNENEYDGHVEDLGSTVQSPLKRMEALPMVTPMKYKESTKPENFKTPLRTLHDSLMSPFKALTTIRAHKAKESNVMNKKRNSSELEQDGDVEEANTQASSNKLRQSLDDDQGGSIRVFTKKRKLNNNSKSKKEPAKDNAVFDLEDEESDDEQTRVSAKRKATSKTKKSTRKATKKKLNKKQAEDTSDDEEMEEKEKMEVPTAKNSTRATRAAKSKATKRLRKTLRKRDCESDEDYDEEKEEEEKDALDQSDDEEKDVFQLPEEESDDDYDEEEAKPVTRTRSRRKKAATATTTTTATKVKSRRKAARAEKPKDKKKAKNLFSDLASRFPTGKKAVEEVEDENEVEETENTTSASRSRRQRKTAKAKKYNAGSDSDGDDDEKEPSRTTHTRTRTRKRTKK